METISPSKKIASRAPTPTSLCSSAPRGACHTNTRELTPRWPAPSVLLGSSSQPMTSTAASGSAPATATLGSPDDRG